MPEDTAACRIEWKNGAAVAGPPCTGADDFELDGLIVQAQAIGIDSPFGWPLVFAKAVSNWTENAWNERIRDRLRFRLTDLVVRDRVKLFPLSVSSDRIALPAMRAMSLLRRFHVTDRSGDGRFFEVYPAGTLSKWDMLRRGYKQKNAAALAVRKSILSDLRVALPWLVAPVEYAETDHSLDALIASLTARAAAQGLTFRPEPSQEDSARKEGWVHLPSAFPHP